MCVLEKKQTKLSSADTSSGDGIISDNMRVSGDAFY